MALVNEVADRADRWTGHDAWTFEPDSPASAEVANTEMRLDGSPWGERPVRTVYQYAQMETKLAVELSRCAALLIGAARPAPGIEAVTRASLEAGSVGWGVLAGGVTARAGARRAGGAGGWRGPPWGGGPWLWRLRGEGPPPRGGVSRMRPLRRNSAREY